MKRKKHVAVFPAELKDELEITLIGNVKKSSIIIRQIEGVLNFTPEKISFSVKGGVLELVGSHLTCSVFQNGAFRISGQIRKLDIREEKRK